MKAVKRKSRKKSIVLRISLAAFAIYVVAIFIGIQIQLNDAKKRKNDVDEQVRTKTIQNEDLQGKVDNYEIHQEQGARDKGYVYPGEDVIIVAPGT